MKKTVSVNFPDWQVLCTMKAETNARDLAEVIARLLNAHRGAVLSQKSLIKEGARYD